MKWRIIAYGSLVMGWVLLIAGFFNWPYFFWFITASLVCDGVFFAVRKKMVEEGAASLWKMQVRLAEMKKDYRLVDAALYPEEVTSCYDRLQRELEAKGFIFAGDVVYSAIVDNPGMCGKTFLRLLHNADCTVWASIFKMNPSWRRKSFFRLIGMSGFLEGFVSLNITYTDGDCLDCSNIARDMYRVNLPFSHKFNFKGATVYELIGKLMEKNRELNRECKPIATLDEAMGEIYRMEIAEAQLRLSRGISEAELIANGCKPENAAEFMALYNRVRPPTE